MNRQASGVVLLGCLVLAAGWRHRVAKADGPSMRSDSVQHDARYDAARIEAPVHEAVEEARWFVIGDGVDRDLDRAIDLYGRACDQGDREGCIATLQVGRIWTDVQATATEFLVRRCHEGDVRSCRAEFPWHFTYRFDQPWLKRACDGGFAAACTMAGRFVEACKLGDPGGCFTLAHSRRKQARTWRRAGVALLRMGCEQGVGRDCWQLAALHYTGVAQLDDEHAADVEVKAETLLLAECRAGAYASCRRLAAAEQEYEPSPAQLEAHTMACFFTPRTCRPLAERYRRFRLGYLAIYRRLFEVGCRSKSRYIDRMDYRDRKDNCLNGAQVYLQEDASASRDPVRAEELLQLACDEGSTDACKSERAFVYGAP